MTKSKIAVDMAKGTPKLKGSTINVRDKSTEWPKLEFEVQPMEEIVQLETMTDQIGSTAVDHIYKRCREIFGQTPVDLKPVNWKDFGINDWVGRPSPYDFPAFEHERDVTILAKTVEGDKYNGKTKATQSLEKNGGKTKATESVDNRSKVGDNVSKSKKSKSQKIAENKKTATLSKNSPTVKNAVEEKKLKSQRNQPTKEVVAVEDKKSIRK